MTPWRLTSRRNAVARFRWMTPKRTAPRATRRTATHWRTRWGHRASRRARSLGHLPRARREGSTQQAFPASVTVHIGGGSRHPAASVAPQCSRQRPDSPLPSARQGLPVVRQCAPQRGQDAHARAMGGLASVAPAGTRLGCPRAVAPSSGARPGLELPDMPLLASASPGSATHRWRALAPASPSPLSKVGRTGRAREAFTG